MKILRLIHTMDPVSGGPCQGIRNAIPVWDKAGHESQIVCIDRPDAAYLRSEELNILPLGPSQSAWGYSKNLLPWLLNHLSEYDAVIVHGLWQYHGYCLSKAIDKLRNKSAKVHLPKVYIMTHGMLDPYFQKSPDRKLKAIRNRIYWHLIESKVINRADGLFFTCQEELLLARTSFKPYHPKREINVGYGVMSPNEKSLEMQSMFFSKCPNVAGKPFLLFLSRIHPKKGVDLLLEAYCQMFSEWSRKLSEFPCLVIAGPGKETVFGLSLQSFVVKHKLEQFVYFTGMLEGNSKWGAFYECDAFVLMSHQENFGISVAEALSCGKTVLISDQVNIHKEISASGAGLVAPDNITGTLQNLKRWFSLSESEKKEFEANAKNCFISNFQVKAAATRMIHSIQL